MRTRKFYTNSNKIVKELENNNLDTEERKRLEERLNNLIIEMVKIK